MIETIRRWYENAPAPVVWLAVVVFLYFWLLIMAVVGALLGGGFAEVASYVPGYASKTGVKFLTLYLALLALYLLFRFGVYILRQLDWL